MSKFVILTALIALSQSQTIRRLPGGYAQSKPCFLEWHVNNNVTNILDSLGLMADTLNNVPATNDNVYIFRYPGRYMSNPSAMPRLQIAGRYSSTRHITQIPDNAFGEPVIAVQDGTDALNKQRGSVHVVQVSDWANTNSYQIAGNTLFNPQEAYTSSVWMHANADPAMDAFTCRRNYDSPMRSELLILWQPLVFPFVRHWEEMSLHNGSCDTYLTRVVLRAQVGPVQRNFDVLFTSGYYSRQLMITWTNQQTGLWADIENVQSRVIQTGKKYFHIVGEDLNNDGIPEIIVSNKDTVGGSLEVLEAPSDFRVGQFISHVILGGLTGRGEGAPGYIAVFKPITADTGKPWIALAGAENGLAYYLRPTSQDPNVWTYEAFQIPVNCGAQGYVCGVAARDVDFDGYTELFFSCQNQDIIQVWTFRPA